MKGDPNSTRQEGGETRVQRLRKVTLFLRSSAICRSSPHPTLAFLIIPVQHRTSHLVFSCASQLSESVKRRSCSSRTFACSGITSDYEFSAFNRDALHRRRWPTPAAHVCTLDQSRYEHILIRRAASRRCYLATVSGFIVRHFTHGQLSSSTYYHHRDQLGLVPSHESCCFSIAYAVFSSEALSEGECG